MKAKQLDIRAWRKRERAARIIRAASTALAPVAAVAVIVLYILILAEPTK
ncbi:hypothetical protein [Frigoribacterium sp. CG_9.8]|nr:hypothetical protein [Frigoribacterium sp. CG_9.8]MBG6106570.1 hypothetical protein [Frigoribacterium sp. CG_9.8]